ncbi:MAG: DNA repair protein RecN [Chitinophagaceae bacterium]|nr:DNA repair protein RecN [Chitinophagaceae bacterium]MBK7557217.1 DNA repair protein RecN [Chitinophagaceae bacterium]MBK9532614.1 DNA repair protein RecN [Chitinophagaceae bacterium]
MLQKLNIQNYAIINELEIDFSDKLNIITGETGAGKSIVMGALSLILGERADSTVLQEKDKKAVVEGTFKAMNKEAIRDFLKENELDAEEMLIIRREIAANGKSRAFINDTPVNLSQLKTLSSLLVDLHQQFDTQELGSSDFQQEVLDALAGNGELLQQYQYIFHQYKKAKKDLSELQAQQVAANAALDYNRFLFDELNEANFTENELEELDAELKLLGNAENIKQELAAACYPLKESEEPIVQQIKSLVNKLHALEKYHAGIAELSKRMQSTQLELADIADELEHINNSVHYSAERIQLVSDRISMGYKLQKKHQVTSTNELIAIKDDLQKKLDQVLNISEAILQNEKETAALLDQCNDAAKKISANRKKAIKPLSENVNGLLARIGMPNARFMATALPLDALSELGIDRVEFLFNANLPAGQADKSDRYEPLRKVASGGELSRLMLCIKSLVAKKLQLPTLIFDEIDTGISGEAARQVGNIMKELSAAHQLISITHQPQIAAKADAHYFVYKAIDKDKIVTSIRLLNNDERITAIAQMLSGEKPTAAALQNAREMVGN